MPRLLDLFCGAGGCSKGYSLAGFDDITGIDHNPQPRYPYRFVQGDAIRYLIEHGREYDAIHASPPCQRFSVGTHSRGEGRKDHPDLLTPTLNLLASSPVPYVVENVPGAPMSGPVVELCGLMFGLKVFRHRLFACSFHCLAPAHPSHKGKRIGEGGFCTVAGHGPSRTGYDASGTRREVPADHRSVAAWKKAMGIDWMTGKELAQAIPPAFTKHIGLQLINLI